MGINYPNGANNGIDIFNEPSLPEITPLSSKGTSDRNHTESHRDLGAAIVALQQNAAWKIHDHSSTGPGAYGSNKLAQANTHQSPDTDSAPTALHHTLGTGANQAAAGNHNHDYNNLVNIPLKSCTSTSRPTNPTTGMLIFETDTNRVRVWATFPNNVAVVGRNSTDEFNRTSATDLGADWGLTYTLNPSTNGRIATSGGTSASWTDNGNQTHRVIARRTKTTDKDTLTDDQILTWKTGETIIEQELPLTDGATNDGYLRMSANRSSYIRVRVGFDYFKVFYTVAGTAEEQVLGVLNNVQTNIANAEWRVRITDRTLSFFRNGALIGTIADSKAVTSKGSSNRGWGFGMEAGARGLGQATPANIDWIRIQDAAYYDSINQWTLLPMGAVPACRLRQTQAQQLLSAGTILTWGEDLDQASGFNFYNPATPTQILITEPGLYRIEAAIQWNASIVPEEANAVLLINGEDTSVRAQQFMRGNGITPGFSQTLSLSGSLRLAAGDSLSLKAFYKTTSNLLNQIFSAFDGPSNIKSRIDITYSAP